MSDGVRWSVVGPTRVSTGGSARTDGDGLSDLKSELDRRKLHRCKVEVSIEREALVTGGKVFYSP